MFSKHLRLNWFWIFVITVPLSILALLKFRSSGVLVFQILTGMTIIYLISALLHHVHHKNLTLEIFIEYVLMAALALIVLQSLLI